MSILPTLLIQSCVYRDMTQEEVSGRTNRQLMDIHGSLTLTACTAISAIAARLTATCQTSTPTKVSALKIICADACTHSSKVMFEIWHSSNQTIDSSGGATQATVL